MKKIILFFYFLQSLIINAQNPTFGWVKNIQCSSNSIAVDSNLNVYTVGYFYGVVDFDPGSGSFFLSSSGYSDIFVSKLDSLGNFVWAKKMGGTADDYGYDIALDNLGSIYITGNFTGIADFDPSTNTYNLTSAGQTDIFVCKIDTSGNFIWAQQMGGVNNDKGTDIDVDITGNIFTTGDFNGTADFDPSISTFNLNSNTGAVFISKLNSSGNFGWAKNIAGVNYGGFDIKLDKIGNVYTVGQFFGTKDFDPGIDTFNLTSAGYEDVFTSKLDSLGNFVWAKSTGSPSNDGISSVAIDENGNIYTTGKFIGTVDFDPGLNTYNLSSSIGNSIYVSKLDANGNFKWAKNIGSTLDNYGLGIALDCSQNVYYTGYFQGNVDFDPGINNFNISSNGYNDIFIGKLDSSGNFLWVQRMGGTGDDVCSQIIVNNTGNIYTIGKFQGTIDFDPGINTFTLNSVSSNDSYIHKLNSNCFNNIFVKINNNNKVDNKVKIIPNPNNGYFTVELVDNSKIDITDILGRSIFSKFLEAGKNNLNLSGESNGVYLIEINTSKNRSSNKIVLNK